MRIEDLVQQKGPEILARWRRMIAETYPPQTAAFLLAPNDRFRNPVGYVVFRQSAALLDALLRRENSECLSGLVDPLVRIRAVQEVTPAQAVGFAFRLKEAVRQELASDIRDSTMAASLLEFESRIDALALVAFDRYMQCREQIYKLRADEVKRQSRRALERTARMDERAEKAVEGSMGA